MTPTHEPPPSKNNETKARSAGIQWPGNDDDDSIEVEIDGVVPLADFFLESALGVIFGGEQLLGRLGIARHFVGGSGTPALRRRNLHPVGPGRQSLVRGDGILPVVNDGAALSLHP